MKNDKRHGTSGTREFEYIQESILTYQPETEVSGRQLHLINMDAHFHTDEGRRAKQLEKLKEYIRHNK